MCASRAGPGGKLTDSRRPHQGEALSFSIEWFDEVSSTNDIASELAESGAAEGTVVVSKSQTAGRGRHSRSWFSPEGGLYFTLILRPLIPADKAQLLAIAGALAVADAIELSILTSPQLKWPNDVYLLGKKVSGILAETQVSSAFVQLALLGVGVNTQRPDVGVPDSFPGIVVWLSDVVRKAPDTKELLTAMLGSFTVWYQRLLSSDFVTMRDAYNRRNLLIGKELEVKTRDGVVVGHCKGIDSRGALLAEDESGATIAITEGDVCSWS